VYWRAADGAVRVADREGFAGQAGGDAALPVFDTTVTTAGDWRVRFERPLAESWHAQLVG